MHQFAIGRSIIAVLIAPSFNSFVRLFLSFEKVEKHFKETRALKTNCIMCIVHHGRCSNLITRQDEETQSLNNHKISSTKICMQSIFIIQGYLKIWTQFI